MNERVAGFVDLRGGMNAGQSPLLIADTQCARAINVSFRGGLVSTRPAFAPQLGVTIPAGMFCGMGRWSLEFSDYLVMVVNSTVYALCLGTMQLTSVATFSAPAGMQCFFVQAHRYMIVQNGIDTPVVLEEVDGVVARVESEEIDDPQSEDPADTIDSVSVPAGTISVYAHGRVHVVPRYVPNTTESGKMHLVSGDILQCDDPETVLRFTETEYLANGGAHALPLELGYIGGLGVLRNAQTGTGLGNVVVLARTGSCAFDFSLTRDDWTAQALSTVLFQGPGCRSPWSVINVNDDLVYRGLDGLRTMRYSVSQLASASGSLSDTPLSIPVDTFLEQDYAGLPYVSTALYNNRVFTTAMYANNRRFHGLIAWDVAASFYTPGGTSAVYDGLWTGVAIQQVAFALMNENPNVMIMSGGNKLYRLDDEARVLDPDDTPIQARIETKAYTFDEISVLKKLEYVELWLADVEYTTEVKVWYRPHGYPLWKPLGTRTLTVGSGSLPQYFPKIRLSVDFSEANCNPITGEALFVSTAFQFAIQWTGRATIERFQAVASASLEQPPYPCDIAGVVVSPSDAAGEVLSDTDYHFSEE